MAITNKSLNTLIFVIDGKAMDLYPGMNLLSGYDEELLSNDDRVLEFIDEGILVFTGIEKKVYTDKETGVSYIDDSGTKIPVSEQGKTIEPLTESNNQGTDTNTVQYRTLSKKFKASELRKLGISAENATKIISATPPEGYKGLDEIPDIGDDKDKLTPIFESNE